MGIFVKNTELTLRQGKEVGGGFGMGTHVYPWCTFMVT